MIKQINLRLDMRLINKIDVAISSEVKPVSRNTFIKKLIVKHLKEVSK